MDRLSQGGHAVQAVGTGGRRRALWLCAALSGWLAGAGASADRQELPVLKVGDPAPVLRGMYSDGDTAAVRPWRWTGRHTLLAFWSHRSPASVRQLDELRRLYRDFGGDKRFQIVSVCTIPNAGNGAADEWEAWIAFLNRQPEVLGPDGGRQRFHLAWPQLLEAERFDPKNFPRDEHGLTSSGRYGATELPAAFLIGPDGRLAAVRVPTPQWRQTVGRALRGR